MTKMAPSGAAKHAAAATQPVSFPGTAGGRSVGLYSAGSDAASGCEAIPASGGDPAGLVLALKEHNGCRSRRPVTAGW